MRHKNGTFLPKDRCGTLRPAEIIPLRSMASFPEHTAVLGASPGGCSGVNRVRIPSGKLLCDGGAKEQTDASDQTLSPATTETTHPAEGAAQAAFSNLDHLVRLSHPHSGMGH